MEIFIKRQPSDDKQTLGTLDVKDFNGVSLFSCKTLELAWKGNQKRISCIPKGTYKVVKRFSPKYGNHLHILDVPNRSFILIHATNYWFQLLGCIAVGQAHIDLNKDGKLDTTNSKLTLAKLVAVLPKETILTIS